MPGDGPPRVSEFVVVAAWLHDVGYAPALATTGFHALDGAVELARRGLPSEVVSLVAHHTGGCFEAEERGLVEEWRRFPEPHRDSLGILTMLDLSVGPSGDPVLERDRVAEIQSRYGEDDPVYRVVARSAPELIRSCLNAKRLLGLPNEWHIASGQSVIEFRDGVVEEAAGQGQYVDTFAGVLDEHQDADPHAGSIRGDARG